MADTRRAGFARCCTCTKLLGKELKAGASWASSSVPRLNAAGRVGEADE
jgi:hypothetical protein